MIVLPPKYAPNVNLDFSEKGSKVGYTAVRHDKCLSDKHFEKQIQVLKPILNWKNLFVTWKKPDKDLKKTFKSDFE